MSHEIIGWKYKRGITLYKAQTNPPRHFQYRRSIRVLNTWEDIQLTFFCLKLVKRVVPEKKWIPGILFPITSGKNLIQILDPALPYFCSCGVLMVTVLLSSLNSKTFPLQWHHCNPHEYKCQQYQCHDSNHHHAWLRATLLSSGGWAPFLWMWIQNRQQNHLATPFHQKLFFWDKIVIVTLSGSGNCLKLF